MLCWIFGPRTSSQTTITQRWAFFPSSLQTRSICRYSPLSITRLGLYTPRAARCLDAKWKGTSKILKPKLQFYHSFTQP
jgi:hypothetical protein